MIQLRQKETMSSRERVLRTFAHERTDRVPINYCSNPGLDLRLKTAFGLRLHDHEGLMQALGVDFRGVGTPYTGPRLHEPVPGRNVHPEWGWHTRIVEHGSGSYDDYCDFPLADADEEQVAAWPLPDPDDYDYSRLDDQCRRYDGLALHVGGAGLACIMNTAGFFRGMEQVFVDLATDDPAGLLLIDRFLDIQYEQTARTLEKVGRTVDFVWMGEDLGTQRGPLISPELFRRQILPRQKRFFDLAKAYDLPVLFHTCGSSSWAYEDYIAIGMNGVDTLQPEAYQMAPLYLKTHFGSRLFYHGCISTTGVLSFGSVDDVTADVRATLAIMMDGYGYCLAPTHAMQDNTPTENVLAMYAAAHQFGRY